MYISAGDSQCINVAVIMFLYVYVFLHVTFVWYVCFVYKVGSQLPSQSHRSDSDTADETDFLVTQISQISPAAEGSRSPEASTSSALPNLGSSQTLSQTLAYSPPSPIKRAKKLGKTKTADTSILGVLQNLLKGSSQEVKRAQEAKDSAAAKEVPKEVIVNSDLPTSAMK
jgi:hypothetical protein